MFAEDYGELGLPGAEQVAARCFLFEDFLETVLAGTPDALDFSTREQTLVIHAHCHAKALTEPARLFRLLQRLPGRTVRLLETGCCGMAGAFGALESKYELSVKIAEPLVERIRAQPAGTTVVASGTSCRHQIEHLATIHPYHPAEVLAEAI
jgi:Fe-S oxidoreductase